MKIREDSRFKPLSGRRVVLLGVGRPGRGDDAAGDELARRLSARGITGAIAAGSAPENYLGPVLLLRPEVVVVADAAEMGRRPGEWALHPAGAVASGSVSTHSAPLSLVMDYLAKEGKVHSCLLAIQAKGVAEGEGMSREVEGAVEDLADLLAPLVART